MTPEYENRREYFRQRYIQNRERLLMQTKAYQATHPEIVRRARRRYYAKNAEMLKAKRRAAYAANPLAHYEGHRRWIKKNAETRVEYMRRWRQEQIEHRRIYDAVYKQAHKAERAERQNARRARQIGNGGSHTREQWELLKEAFGHKCGYCGADGVQLTKDHGMPLARGGTDDISNIIPACLPCNRRKHVKTAGEFMAVLWASRTA